MTVYDPERIARLAQISTKFHAHAAKGDRIALGIEGDSQMPAKYRGSRPTGTIVRIKNEGTENSTLRVALDSGRQIDLHPNYVGGDRVWEFTEDTWPKVLARSNPQEATFRGSGDDVGKMRQEIAEMTRKFDIERAEAKSFNDALVESLAQITNEISQSNPKARFSRVFQEEYKGARRMDSSPFDSDMDSDED